MVKNKPHKAGEKLYDLDRRRLDALSNVMEKELGSLLHPDDRKMFAIRHQLKKAKKKFRLKSSLLEKDSYEKFLAANDSCGNTNITLDPSVVSNARLFITRALERFTSSYDSSPQNELDLGLLLSLWKFGPGASVGTGNNTSFIYKLLKAPWTVTRSALPLVKLMILLNPRLHRIAVSRFGCDASPEWFNVVEGSSLSFVLKNETSYRSICTEPLMNMALQLAAGLYIEGALRAIGLDISQQAELNKLLAKLAYELGLATIDLSMASDLICLALVKALWPTSWYELFLMIRSPETRYKEAQIHLNMVSTMGNGFTFPMMTLTLVALIYGTGAEISDHRNLYIDFTKFGVFGDDIICPQKDFSTVTDVLCRAGLVVNNDKSYASGDFFESCGGDYYRGYEVTPMYIKSLANEGYIYIAINQFIRWAGTHRVYAPGILTYLLSLVEKPLFVPCWEDQFAGIFSTVARKRYRRLKVVTKTFTMDVTGCDDAVILSALHGSISSVKQRGRIQYGKIRGDQRNPQGSYTDFVLDPVIVRWPKGYLTGHSHKDLGYDIIDWFESCYAEILSAAAQIESGIV